MGEIGNWRVQKLTLHSNEEPHIHVETLSEDAKFYTRPITYSRTWVAGKADEELHE